MNEWLSLHDFFYDINQKCEYLILRNWSALENETPYMDGHEDIDILCNNLDHFLKVTGAKSIHYLDTRNNYSLLVGSNNVRLDVRFVGDGYYDSNWELTMLHNRTLKHGFYTVSDEMFGYSIAYHALVHKPFLSSEYSSIISESLHIENDKDRIIEVLREYCAMNNYYATVPRDPGVHFNKKQAKIIGLKRDDYISINRFLFRLKLKLNCKV